MIFKEYKGFCERCGKRLETARYIIKLCEHCRMWKFTKNWAECNSSPTSQTSPKGDFSNEKEHNISLKESVNTDSQISSNDETSLNNNIQSNFQTASSSEVQLNNLDYITI